MFDKLASTPSKKKKTVATVEMPLTIAFVTVVRDQGFRLSYSALTLAAQALGEDSSNQIIAQRGSALAKMLPAGLQPFICRKAGGYHKAVLTAWTVELPENLRSRPVIDKTGVGRAVEIHNEKLAKADAEG